MEEHWNVIYVDRISGRELTSRNSRQQGSRFPSCQRPQPATHDEVLRITSALREAVIDQRKHL